MTTTLQPPSPEEPVAPPVALRTVDLGERFQPRLERLATFLEHLGWRFRLQGRDLERDEVMQRDFFFPVLVGAVALRRQEQGIPTPGVWFATEPTAIAEVVVMQDEPPDQASWPWDTWIMALLAETLWQQTLTSGFASTVIDLDPVYDRWSEAVNGKRFKVGSLDTVKNLDTAPLTDNVPILDAVGPPSPFPSLVPCPTPAPGLKDNDRWKSLTEPLPLKPVAIDLILWQDTLNGHFPWMHPLTARLFRTLYVQQRRGQPLQLPTLALLGESGLGKTVYLIEALRLLDHPCFTLNLSGANDSVVIKGTSQGWSSSRPSFPSIAMASSRCANPVIVLDEIDKAGGTDHNGRAFDALLPLLEPSTAARYMDDGLTSTVDTSRLSWLLTLNDENALPSSLRSRVETVEVAGPTWTDPEHMEAALRMGEALVWQTRPDARDDRYALSPEQKDALRRVRWTSLRSLGQRIRTMIEDNLYRITVNDDLAASSGPSPARLLLDQGTSGKPS